MEMTLSELINHCYGILSVVISLKYTECPLLYFRNVWLIMVTNNRVVLGKTALGAKYSPTFFLQFMKKKTYFFYESVCSFDMDQQPEFSMF